MPETLSRDCTVRLFADDTLLYMAITSPQDAQNMQNDLDKIPEWEKTWDMQFHPDKCVVLRVKNKLASNKPVYYLRGHQLRSVDSTMYLGIEISSDLRWSKHVVRLCKKAIRTIGFLKRNANISSRSIKEPAYKSLVRPQVEYASPVWDPSTHVDINRVEMVHRHTTGYVCNRFNNNVQC